MASCLGGMESHLSLVASSLSLKRSVRCVSNAGVSVEDVLLDVGERVGHGNIISVSRLNKAVVVFLKEETLVNRLVESGITVSQVVLGLLIISYSLPLLSAETTMIINFGVPWWSGLMFVISGAVAIVLEKKPSTKTLCFCLAVSFVAIIISVIALVVYYIDIADQMTITCDDETNQLCMRQYYARHFCKGVKIIISMIILVQTGMSCAFTFLLYDHRKNFTDYLAVNE